jgi:hypothetical protein
LACFGAGRALLAAGRFETRDRAIRNIAAFAIGMDVFALLVSLLYFTGVKGLAAWTAIALAAPAAAWGATRALKELPGIASGVKRRPLTTALLCVAPAIYLGAALCPPAGWDELVYQLAAPRRWLLDGLPLCYADLPYSAFPSLPQTLYWPLMLMGDAMAAKLFAFAVFIAMLPATYRLCRLKASPLLAAVATFAVALTPVSSFLVKERYAEQFIALNLLAAVLLSFDRKAGTAKTATFCGIMLGACAAVKLTGLFIGPAFLLFFIFKRRSSPKTWIPLIFAAALFAAPFYLRPWMETGNPVQPYFASVFKPGDAAAAETAAFHREIGSARFGVDGVPGLLLSPLMLGVPLRSFSDVFDGSYGLQAPAFLLLCAYLLRFGGDSKRRGALALFGLAALLYVAWFLSAKQARFLLPSFELMAILGAWGMAGLPYTVKKWSVLALALLAAISFPPAAAKHCALAWKGVGSQQEQASFVYSSTGTVYLRAVDAMLKELPEKSRTLLLFEERGLYMPRPYAIGTPFFQSARLTPPDEATPEKLLATLEAGAFSHLYLRSPEDCPDLVKSYFERSAALWKAVAELERSGRLKLVWSLAEARFYEVVKDALESKTESTQK